MGGALRKAIMVSLLLLAGGAFAAGQEQKMALGFGLEWNMNSRENFAGGAALGFGYNLPHALAAGLTVSGSSNFGGIGVVETSALLRRYFPGREHAGFFAQADLGLSLILEDGEATPLFLGGLRAGYRLPVGSLWYVEPFDRLGYPYLFGVGVTAGIKF